MAQDKSQADVRAGPVALEGQEVQTCSGGLFARGYHHSGELRRGKFYSRKHAAAAHATFSLLFAVSWNELLTHHRTALFASAYPGCRAPVPFPARSQVIAPEDVALYGGLCALATFEREDMKRSVLDNPRFRNFLELYPAVRELLQDFYNSRYGSCLSYLSALQVRESVSVVNAVMWASKKKQRRAVLPQVSGCTISDSA